jgi:hypothetical protein
MSRQFVGSVLALFLMGAVLLVHVPRAWCASLGERGAAAREAGKRLAVQLERTPALFALERLAVAEIEGDERDFVRSRLMSALVERGRFQMLSPAELKSELAKPELSRVFSEMHGQLRYEDFYDKHTLVEMGRIVALQAIVVGLIEGWEGDWFSPTLFLQVKVLNLREGEVFAFTLAPLSPRAMMTRGILLLAVGLVLVWFILKGGYYHRTFPWVAAAVVFFGAFWVLLGRHLM